MHSRAKSGWHRVGQRIASFCGLAEQAVFDGRVRLTSGDPRAHPAAVMNLLGDERDAARLEDGLRLITRVLRRAQAKGAIAHPFAVHVSPFIPVMSPVRPRNRIAIGLVGPLLDGPAWLRRRLVRFALSNAPPLDELVADEERLLSDLRGSVLSVSRVSGT